MTAVETPKRDPYPESFELEIDRAALCRYFRWEGTLNCWAFGVMFGFLFSILLLLPFVDHYRSNNPNGALERDYGDDCRAQ